MPEGFENCASSGFSKVLFSMQPIFLDNLLKEQVFD